MGKHCPLVCHWHSLSIAGSDEPGPLDKAVWDAAQCLSVMGFHTGKGRCIEAPHRSSWVQRGQTASGAGGSEKTDTVQLVQVGILEAPLVQGLEVLLVALLGQEQLKASRDNNLKQRYVSGCLGQAEKRKQSDDLLGLGQLLCVSAGIWVCKCEHHLRMCKHV